MFILSTWIHSHQQQLSVALTAGRKLDSINPWQDNRSTATSTETTTTASACRSRRRRRTEIPNPSMHTRGRRERLRRPHPVRRNIECLQINCRSFVFTGKLPNYVAGGLENLEC